MSSNYQQGRKLIPNMLDYSFSFKAQNWIKMHTIGIFVTSQNVMEVLLNKETCKSCAHEIKYIQTYR